MIATPTQPYTHRKSVATLPSLEPPAIPWAMIHAQPTNPMTRNPVRSGTRGRDPALTGCGATARTSRTITKANDSATAVAAPTR